MVTIFNLTNKYYIIYLINQTDDIIFAKTRGFINHKDIIKSQIKNIGIKKNNYVVFNRRKDLGKTIGEKLITCSGGINTENKLMAKQLFS